MVGFFCADSFLGGVFGGTAALDAASSVGAAPAPQLNNRIINAEPNRKFARARGRPCAWFIVVQSSRSNREISGRGRLSGDRATRN